MFITSVEYVSDVEADLTQSTIEYYKGTTMQSTVALSNSNGESEIKYKVTVYNNSDESQDFNGVLYDKEFYDNENIVFEISGFTFGETINSKEFKEIIITFKYKDSQVPDNSVLNSYLNFKFGNPNRLIAAKSVSDSNSNYLRSTVARNKIESIKFELGNVPQGDIIEQFDASEKQDESIIGYYTDVDENELYELTFVSNELIYGNVNSDYLFEWCTNLTNIEFTNFSTKGVTRMVDMFYECSSLTSLDVSNFDTSQVTSMYSMFEGCSGLTSLDVSNFDTSNVTKMSSMFSSCSKLTSLDVSKFNTSKVTNMDNMFYSCSSLTSLDVSKFDTSQAINMEAMFQSCKSLTSIDASKFNTSQVTNMRYMFYNCRDLMNLDVSGFDTSQVTNMGEMFYSCSSLTSLDVSGFKTSKVENMLLMFAGCEGLTSLDVSGFDTSKVTDVSYMFYHCEGLTSLDVSNFDTSKVTDMSYMFFECNNLTSLDISNFDTSKVTNMMYMFQNCRNLTTIYVSEYNEGTGKGWTTKNVIESTNMFINCTKLVGQNGTTYDSNYTDATYARIDLPETPGYLSEKTATLMSVTLETDEDGELSDEAVYMRGSIVKNKIESIKFVNGEVPENGVIEQFDASEAENGSIIGYYTDEDNNEMYELTFVSKNQIYANENSECLFEYLIKLKEITFENFNTSKVTNMQMMFFECENLIDLDLSNFDTSNVTDMTAMFFGCTTLASIDTKVLNTSNVISMAGMFMGCMSITNLDLSTLNTSKVESMEMLFCVCMGLTDLDLSGLNTSNVTDMQGMFMMCGNLTTLDLSVLDTSQVENMGNLFNGCESLTSIELAGLDTSNVSVTAGMFADCTNLLSIDLSEFNTSKLVITDEMFKNCSNLTTIYVSEYNEETGKGWITEMVASSTDMFTDCAKLVGGCGTTYDSNNTDATYARIDTVLQPGYFTNINGDESIETMLMKLEGENLSEDTAFLRGTIARNKIESIKFITGEVPESGVVEQFDASEAENGSIIGYYTDEDDNEYYELTFVSQNQIYANRDSRLLFAILPYVREITFENFDTRYVENMTGMFYYTFFLNNLDLSGFNTSKVTNMAYMFGMSLGLNNLDLSGFDTSQVINMSCMFAGNYFTDLDLSGFNTSKVIYMESMFEACMRLKELDLSSFNTSKLEEADQMFKDSSNLTAIYVSEYNETTKTGWTTTKITSSSNMFDGCSSLVGQNGTVYNSSNTDAAYAQIGTAGKPGYFTDINIDTKKTILMQVTLNNGNDSDEENYLRGTIGKNKIENVKFIKGKMSENGVIEKFDASETQDGSIIGYYTDIDNNGMYELTFASEKYIYANIDSSSLFAGLNQVKDIEFDNFNTTHVSNMQRMFDSCQNLADIYLEGFYTSNVTNMNSMFKECKNITNIDVSKFDTSKVTDMSSMFDGSIKIEKIDLSKWNTSKVTNMNSMFKNCCALTTIYVSDYDETTDKWWTTKSVIDSADMFINCYNLVGQKGTTYDINNIDAIYARIDIVREPGYLTNIMKLIDSETNYVGYYADVDGDGIVDGIIYADLLHGKTGTWPTENDNTYTIQTIQESEVKEYYISDENYTGGKFGENKVIVAKKQATEKDRFFVMALSDVNSGKKYAWYENAGSMEDYKTVTSKEFGKGKENTQNMIEKWNKGENGGYGIQDDDDLWGAIQKEVKKGWFVPSKDEWSAFAVEFEITTSNYWQKGLKKWYWSSSQYSELAVSKISLYDECFKELSAGSNRNYVRLSITF